MRGDDGVTLYALPRGLWDLPRPFNLGLCGLWPLGVPLEGARPDLDPWLFADRKLEVLESILSPFVEVDRE